MEITRTSKWIGEEEDGEEDDESCEATLIYTQFIIKSYSSYL